MTFYFQNIHDFLHMGGYAAYVWSAYAICITVLVINLIIPVRRFANRLRLLRSDRASKA